MTISGERIIRVVAIELDEEPPDGEAPDGEAGEALDEPALAEEDDAAD